jgi:hypothetical protein
MSDPDVRLWHWLQAPPPAVPMFMGHGDKDRFADGMSLLARAPAGRAAMCCPATTTGRPGCRCGSAFWTPGHFERCPVWAGKHLSRPWSPSPFIKASAALHAGGAAWGTVADPASWPWALGALVVNHAVITTAGLLPRTTLLGPNLTRLPAAARRGARSR